MSRPLELPPVPKETLGWVCRSIALSPVVSTTCTLGPPDVICVVWVERGQLLRKRQVMHTHGRRESRALPRSRLDLRGSRPIITLWADIVPSRRRSLLAVIVADKDLMRVKSLESSLPYIYLGGMAFHRPSQSFPPPLVWATLGRPRISGRFPKAAQV